MPTVFAPQQPSKHDSASGLWIPTINLTPAEKFGKLRVILPPNANRLHAAPLVAAIKDAMANYTEEDALIAVGDPSLIAAAACIASRKTGGRLRLLKWDRMAGDYILVEMNV